MLEASQTQSEGPNKKPLIPAEIGENVEQFAKRIIGVMENSKSAEVRGRFGQVDLKVVSGTTVQDVLEAYKKGNVPQPKRTPSGIEIFSPAIGSNPYEFIKSTFERAMTDNTPVALEISGITFVIDPQQGKVLFDRVNYHLDPKKPITLEDVMRYLESVKQLKRRY